MAEALCAGWCDVLEELLQCPVCLEVRENSLPMRQCINGHHLCSLCYRQLQACPICKQYFIETRNLLCEQLSAKFLDIKLDILSIKITEETSKSENCIGTQTDDNESYAFTTSSSTQTEDYEASTNHNVDIQRPEERRQEQFHAPKIGKGTYPCRLGSCTTVLPHARIIGHIRHNHKELFYEFGHNNGSFTERWTLEYTVPAEHDIAFHIKDMGLFFFNISIYPKGDLTGFVQIVNCQVVSRQFTFKLEVGYGECSFSYAGLVQSCRTSKQQLSNDCLFVSAHNMNRIMDVSRMFDCVLTINRKSVQYVV